MKIIISGKQMDLTDGIKDTINEKLGRLDHYLHPETEVRATVHTKKSRQTVEVTVIPISGPIIRAEDSEENLYAAIDVVYDKLNAQLRKYKNRVRDKHQDNVTIRYEENDDALYNDVEDEEEIIINRRKKFDMKPMSAEEAVLQMDLLGHDFYIFRNLETEDLSVVYKRKHGGYGMIENE